MRTVVSNMKKNETFISVQGELTQLGTFVPFCVSIRISLYLVEGHFIDCCQTCNNCNTFLIGNYPALGFAGNTYASVTSSLTWLRDNILGVFNTCCWSHKVLLNIVNVKLKRGQVGKFLKPSHKKGANFSTRLFCSRCCCAARMMYLARSLGRRKGNLVSEMMDLPWVPCAIIWGHFNTPPPPPWFTPWSRFAIGHFLPLINLLLLAEMVNMQLPPRLRHRTLCRLNIRLFALFATGHRSVEAKMPPILKTRPRIGAKIGCFFGVAPKCSTHLAPF